MSFLLKHRFWLPYALLGFAVILMVGTLFSLHAPPRFEHGYIMCNPDSMFDLTAVAGLRRDIALLIALTIALILDMALIVVIFRLNAPRFDCDRLGAGLAEFERGNFAARIDLKDFNERDPRRALAKRLNRLGERFTCLQNQISERYRGELMKADRLASVGELAASMAHEIKNPVAGICNAMQVLTAELAPDDERVPIFKEIQNQAHRMNRAINNLLSYARPAPPELTEGDINSPLQAALALMAGYLQEARIRLTKRLDPALPPVLIDAQQMQQVFVNLILNAIQAMTGGGELTVESFPAGEAVCARVRDTGPGILEDVASEVFTPFFTTKPKGTGLGLAISQSIAQAHKGEITVDSAPGQGAEFTVRLPVFKDRPQIEKS